MNSMTTLCKSVYNAMSVVQCTGDIVSPLGGGGGGGEGGIVIALDGYIDCMEHPLCTGDKPPMHW